MHDEALTREAARLFPHCSRFKGFYLVGGTALAIQIGHRISVDLDLFSKNKLPQNLLATVKRVFSGSSISVTYRATEQLDLFIDGVKITFFHFPYPVVSPCKKIKNVPLATLLEIASMKAFAIGKRLSYKDYIDWYFLLKEKFVDLRRVIAHAKKKFSTDFNDRLFLGQLVSFGDIPPQKIAFLRDPVDRKTVVDFLEKTVSAFKFK